MLTADEQGLTESEVAERCAAGATNDARQETSRSVLDIVRANVLTRFNAILGGLLVVILIVGPLQDALFGIVLVANALVGIVQELRAKRSLDRLALLTVPSASVVRSGKVSRLALAAIVLDDVLVLDRGDQVVVDGIVLRSDHLEVDESLLTGESEPVPKVAGDEVLSGSFVVAGSGSCRATRVGRDAYARQLASEARAFTLVHSELRAGIDRILRIVTWVLVPTAALLVSSQVASHESLSDALRGSVAGIGSMVPEGLVLLTSVAFAAGVVRLARRRVLVQDLAAIEVLARVDVVCLDKTGTLTEKELVMTSLEMVGGSDDAATLSVLNTLASSEKHPNPTLAAIAAKTSGAAGLRCLDLVPFSSARKWSAIDCGDSGAWILGAPEIVMPDRGDVALLARVEALAEDGGRVVLLARAVPGLSGEQLPASREPAALVVLQERVRSDARGTLAFFAAQGVAVKVLSGDHPATVASVAARVGLEPGSPVDARELRGGDVGLEQALSKATVFGRVSPQQKRAMVAALQRQGHVVAMTGDGVNDVLALKAADLGVAMASGSSASRAVAPIVLLDSSFAGLPQVLDEGRRVIANIERVACLFVTKTVYAWLLALSVGVARLPFPFLPRHLTVISSLTIGIPAFFLALAPNTERARPAFVNRVVRFAVPAGTVAAAATFAAYALARSEPSSSMVEARTGATLALFGIGLWVLGILARPWTIGRQALVVAMAMVFACVMALPPARTFFELDAPTPLVAVEVLGAVAVGNAALEVGWRVSRSLELRWRRRR